MDSDGFFDFSPDTSGPSAPEGCYSLTRWRQNGQPLPAWVGGRLLQSGVQWLLISAQESESLRLRGLESAGEQSGALVAVLLSRETVGGDFDVEKVCLLQGAGRDWPLKKSKVLRAWPRFLADVRRHFDERGLQEIQTPSLVPCPGLEPSLEPFATERILGSKSEKVYFPTSPEIHLKKALCLGWTDLFEIKTCFRNGERSELHRPEFEMLEWYRAYARLDQISDDIGGLLEFLNKNGWIKDGGAELVRTTFRDLFAEQLGFDLTPRTSREEWVGLCRRLNIDFTDADSSDDLFHRLWFEKIEPTLHAPTVVWGFPPSQAALARIHSSGFADRFEFYWRGVEIANAFHEVNGADEQLGRWEAERRERRHLRASDVPIDQELVDWMRDFKMPPTAGIALGLERLFMVCQGLNDIGQLKLMDS